MAEKTVTISITGEEALIDQNVLTYALAKGYGLTILDDDENEIPNPIGPAEFSAGPIGQHIIEVITKYAKEQAALTAQNTVESLIDGVTIQAAED